MRGRSSLHFSQSRHLRWGHREDVNMEFDGVRLTGKTFPNWFFVRKRATSTARGSKNLKKILPRSYCRSTVFAIHLLSVRSPLSEHLNTWIIHWSYQFFSQILYRMTAASFVSLSIFESEIVVRFFSVTGPYGVPRHRCTLRHFQTSMMSASSTLQEPDNVHQDRRNHFGYASHEEADAVGLEIPVDAVPGSFASRPRSRAELHRTLENCSDAVL